MMARVLVVDDEKSIRHSLREFLRTEGYRVFTAADAETAKSVLEREEVDVVVADIIMPGASGVDLLRYVREHAPRVPVVLITAQPTLETATQAVWERAFAYLPKPVTKDVVRRIVAQAATRKRLEDENVRLAEENRRYQENLESLVAERTRKLRESEIKYRLLFSTVGDAILMFDADRRTVVEVNQAAEDLYGYTAEEFKRLNLEDLTADPEEPRFELVRSAEEKVIRIPLSWHRRSDGRRIPVEIACSMFTLNEQRISCFVVRDITDRLKAEQEIVEFSRRLLSTREEEKKKFAAALHHELGSAAFSLSSGLQVAERLARKRDAPEILQAIERCQGILSSSINGLRQLAAQLRPPDLDLLGLPAALEQHLQKAAHQAGFSFECVADPACRDLDVDLATTLFRIAQESITNIMKHARASHVRLELRRGSSLVWLTIADDGRGFDPLEVTRRKTQHMGLRAMGEMAGALGGAFQIASRPGHGTRIEVTLPLAGDVGSDA